MPTVFKHKRIGSGPDRSDKRRERCEQIVRRNFPSAEQIQVVFFGAHASPYATVWHRDAGVRRAKVMRIEEEAL
jgi:hypothetical protein